MKKLIIILLVLPLYAIGQDCQPYIPVGEGATWEITSYSSKGKQTGRSAYELLKRVEEGNSITFTIRSVSYDKKDEKVLESTFEAFCENGLFFFDMAFKMNSESMEAYKDMDIAVEASNYVLPSMDVSAGTVLDDGTLVANIGTSGATIMKMTILITDRKVEGKEKRTTPAGTFDTIILSQKVSTKMIMKVEGASKEWYSAEVGMVRSESYSKSGKLQGYSELTKLDAK